MRRIPEKHTVLSGLGMASLVLGMIGLMLFFLPILGIPISAFGLFFGCAGCFGAVSGAGPLLRWSLGGMALCALALAVNFAILYAPAGYLPQRGVPRPWNPVHDRPWVSPPAR
jgi:hypothetical protein